MADDSLTLTGADAQAFRAYQALNLAPDKIATALAEGATAKAQLAARDLAAVHHTAAAAVGFKPAVLADVARIKGLHIEMRTVRVRDANGQETTTHEPVARYAATADAPLEPLAAFARRELVDYLPALTTSAQADGAGGGDLVDQVLRDQSPRREDASSGASSSDPVAAMLAQLDTRRAEAMKTNPLALATARPAL
jgi:hypothetical protein